MKKKNKTKGTKETKRIKKTKGTKEMGRIKNMRKTRHTTMDKLNIPAQRIITIKSIILLMLLFSITSCTTKPQSLKVIEAIKEDIKQTTVKIETIDNEYKQLIIQKPECRNEVIITNIRTLKSDIINLSNKINITEHLIQTEAKACQGEIRAIKTSNILLKIFLMISSIGFGFILTKARK